jgi:hypothetical protein
MLACVGIHEGTVELGGKRAHDGVEERHVGVPGGMNSIYVRKQGRHVQVCMCACESSESLLHD